MLLRCVTAGVLALLASVGVGGAQRQSNFDHHTAARPSKTVFDVDLTKGNAGAGKVTGGRWEQGWRVVADGDRIVFDAGYDIKEGYLEVAFTADRHPFRSATPLPGTEQAPRVNWVGMYQHASLDQNYARPDIARRGDVFYLRTGNVPRDFSKINVLSTDAKDSCRHGVGAQADWVTDDKTVMRVRLEWKGGVAYVYDTKGKLGGCARNEAGERHVVDALRYAFIGCDELLRLSPVGARFLRLRLVDYGRKP